MYYVFNLSNKDTYHVQSQDPTIIRTISIIIVTTITRIKGPHIYIYIYISGL